jgi:N-acetylneuraminic acid mutarotase
MFEYAEGSLMHYGTHAFSVNGLPTIRSKRGLDHLMGNRSGYGSTDISTVNRLYPAVFVAGWTTKPAMPTARKQFAAGTGKGVLYVVGGTTATSTNVVAKVEAYNPTSNTWAAKAPLPSARWRSGNATTIDGVLYVAGGVPVGGGVTNTLFAYNIATNAWTAKASLPVAGACGGSAAIGTSLYVLIGCDISTAPSAGAKGILLRYDPATNRWTTRAPAPSAHQFGTLTALGTKLYLVGGKGSNAAASNKLEVYNPDNNTWTAKAPLPAARHSHAAHAINGKLYVVGGNDASSGFTNTVYVYDPATNSWSTNVAMTTPRAGFGGGTIGGVLFEVGGYNANSAALASHEAFKP